jgi:5-methylcytosine-specific restriction endonuclease McrA
LVKTADRCHICGGEIDGAWNADHVLAYSGGGADTVENYLAAHGSCNNYRWDYSPEEFQMILKVGVWARTQVEAKTRIGRSLGERFLANERVRLRRRKPSV